MSTSFFLLLVPLWILRAQSLEVTNTSSCADICEGPSLTYSSDLSCSDDEYFTTANGDRMHDCLVCESTSSADNGDVSTPQNNDIYWFLFNMKYTLQYCLFQGNGSTPGLPECEADCAGLNPVLQASWFSPEPAKQYAYCSINDTAFPLNANTCASCLQQQTGSVVLGNLLNAMQSACDNQPDAALGETVPLQRQLFDTTTVNPSATSSATTSSVVATSSGSTASTFTSSSSSSSSASTSPTTGATNTTASAAQSSNSSSSGLSTGAAAGIGIGCTLGAIALISGLAWFILMRRRRNRLHGGAGGHESDYNDSKSGLMSTPHNQGTSSPSSHGGPAYAQQLASNEVHEIDGGQGSKARMLNELDGRAVLR